MTNDLIKSLNVSFLLDDSGGLNIQAVLLKSIIIGVLYHVLLFVFKD
jgi:hypothetical protein